MDLGVTKERLKKSEEKKIKPLQRDKLISNAFSLHSSGKIKEAADVYNSLIQKKFMILGYLIISVVFIQI